jgi:hypothetical protein
MATLAINTHTRPYVRIRILPQRAAALAATAGYALGALALAAEAAVHIQQYAAIFNEVDWIGPLFLANAGASLAAVVGLAGRRTRPLAALAGVAISVVALGSLVVSYGQGLFGWHEGGFRTPIAVAVIAEVASALLLSVALAASARARGVSDRV